MEQSDTKQIVFLIMITLAFLLVIGALVFSEAQGNVPLLKNLPYPSITGNIVEQINRYESDVFIRKHEKLDGDVVVSDGSIRINGEIFGDVIVLYGDIVIENDGIIYGHAIVYQGKVNKLSGAKVAGDILEMYDGKTRYRSCRDVRGISKSIVQYKRNSKISKRERIDGDVVVLKGDLIVDGEVNGDILAISGDVCVRSTGLVIGHIITCNGNVKKSKHGRIIGDTVTNRKGKFSHLKSQSLRNRANFDHSDEAIRARIEKQYLREKTNRDEDVFRFFGDVTIQPNEIIHGDVVIMKGTATVKGEVQGDVLTMFGDVELVADSYVNGNVTSVGGKIWREEGSYVSGDVLETSMRGIRMRKENQSQQARGTRIPSKSKVELELKNRPQRWQRRDFSDETFMFRYNRVEGLFLGIQLPRSYWWEKARHNLAIYGHLGYGISNKDLRYEIGIERWFFDDLRFTVGAKAYDVTESQDEWIIPSLENSLSALLIKEDWQDFYRREGYSAYITQNLTPMLQIGGEYHVDNFYSMSRKTQWALFGGEKKFKENPLIDEFEELKTAVARVTLDTRNHKRHPDQGWYISFEGIFAGEKLENDLFLPTPTGLQKLDFDRYILDIRRYQPLGFGENLDFRLRAGTARGVLPVHYRFDMGGLSTLRGYDYKFFENGDRLVLGNIEYRIHGNRGYLSDIWWLDDFNIILFADAGLVWTAEDNSSYQKSFEHLIWSDLKHDIGIAFATREGDVRLNIAKRTDTGDQPVIVTFRINRAF
ncbi:BamA/TamA family outer membrane protein [candidate division KSB1 bacterium]|nr:BamA/TamA family outer membrane protein [candidate division KSB1 bacterium]